MNRRCFIKTGLIYVPTLFCAGAHGAVRLGNLEPEVGDWIRRVRVNAGAVTGKSVAASDRAMKLVKSAGHRSKILRWNLYCGIGISACKVPLINTKGTTTEGDNGTPLGPFGDADYSEPIGLTGTGTGGPSGKAFDTGFTPSTDWSDDNNCSMGVYMRSETSATDAQMGASSGNVDYLLISYGGTLTYGGMHGTDSQQSFADTNGLGHYMVARRASNSLVVYKNGTSQVSTATPTGNRATSTILVHAYNALNPAYSGRIIAGYEICAGLTAAEVLSHYYAVQTAQTILGRQV
jgi:hypothetical protein